MGHQKHPGRLIGGAAPGAGEEVRRADPHALSRMMDLDAIGAPNWRPEELADILRHQLSAPLLFDLKRLGGDEGRRLEDMTRGGGPRLESFGDALHHPSPPVELLRMIKDFTKSSRTQPDGPLPADVATLLYYAAIGVARLRCGVRITELDDQRLRRGLSWAVAQPWADEATKRVLNEAVSAVGGVNDGS